MTGRYNPSVRIRSYIIVLIALLSAGLSGCAPKPIMDTAVLPADLFADPAAFECKSLGGPETAAYQSCYTSHPVTEARTRKERLSSLYILSASGAPSALSHRSYPLNETRMASRK